MKLDGYFSGTLLDELEHPLDGQRDRLPELVADVDHAPGNLVARFSRLAGGDQNYQLSENPAGRCTTVSFASVRALEPRRVLDEHHQRVIRALEAVVPPIASRPDQSRENGAGFDHGTSEVEFVEDIEACLDSDVLREDHERLCGVFSADLSAQTGVQKLCRDLPVFRGALPGLGNGPG